MYNAFDFTATGMPKRADPLVTLAERATVFGDVTAAANGFEQALVATGANTPRGRRVPDITENHVPLYNRSSHLRAPDRITVLLNSSLTSRAFQGHSLLKVAR